MVHPAHVLQALQLRLKSVCNEGHLILEAETVFRPYLHWDYSRVTEYYHVVLPALALQAVQIALKSVRAIM
jgi:hypothetical protein